MRIADQGQLRDFASRLRAAIRTHGSAIKSAPRSARSVTPGSNHRPTKRFRQKCRPEWTFCIFCEVRNEWADDAYNFGDRPDKPYCRAFSIFPDFKFLEPGTKTDRSRSPLSTRQARFAQSVNQPLQILSILIGLRLSECSQTKRRLQLPDPRGDLTCVADLPDRHV